MIDPGSVWVLWATMVVGVAACIVLEQRYRWAAKTSGPVLALIGAMALSNSGVLPVDAPAYDVVDSFLVPLAIPLLLFRANIVRIWREAGRLVLAFHISAFGTIVGAFIAAALLRGRIPELAGVTGMMTGSYIGGAVNFVALKDSLGVDPELTNPLIVADNIIMAGMFALLLVLSGVRALGRLFPSGAFGPGEGQGSGTMAAEHWRRKEIGLIDLAQAAAVAFVVTAIAMGLAGWMKAALDVRWMQALLGNPYVWMTLLMVGLNAVAHAWIDKIHGAEELGAFLLYLFFFVIGVRADLKAVIVNMPILFVLCLIMAVVNLAVTLTAGYFLRLSLEELLVSVNATLGGAPSAAAMAIAKGWNVLVLPAILVGIWGYVIGTFCGVIVAELL